MIIRNANEALHDEVVKSREDRKKEYDDAMKANAKEAEEIQKGHGETGKKVSNTALKSMHLAESLFEGLDNNKYDKFQSELYNAMTDVIINYNWDGISYSDIENAVDWFMLHFMESEESEYVEESLSLTEKKWNLTLNNSSDLRAAIDDEDYAEVINQIRLAYNQMLEEGIIDEDDYDSWTEDFELYGDFSDWDDPEGTVNYELSNFYDACDNLNVWVAI